MKKQPRGVSIVVLTHNKLRYTEECLEAVARWTENYELVVVDNASTDGTVEYLEALERADTRVRVVRNRTNEGFAAGCNRGVRAAKYGTICLLNNDAIPREGWLDSMLDVLTKGVGAVGSKLLLTDGNLQHCGIHFGFSTDPAPHFWPYHRHLNEPADIPEANVLEEVPGVTAACLLTTKTVWERVGGMDEGYLVANFEDVDFNLAVRDAGLKVLYQPASELLHYWGTTVNSMGDAPDSPRRHFQANFARLQTKWGEKLGRGLAEVKPPAVTSHSPAGERPLNILITLLSFRSLTGSELYVYELAKELRRKGNTVTIVSQIGGELALKAHDHGIELVDFSDIRSLRTRPDVLHVNHFEPTELILRKFTGVPAVATVHSQFEVETPFVDDRILAYVCVRPEIEEHIVTEHGIPREKCRVVYNPIDFRRFRPMPLPNHAESLVGLAGDDELRRTTMRRLIAQSSESGFDLDRKVVVFVGTIDQLRRKSIEHLIARSAEEGFDLRIVGQRHAPYLDGLSLPHVTVETPTWHIERLLMDADETAGVLLGRTTIEGWACGRPGWIYDVDEDGEILSVDLHQPPEDMSKFDSRTVAEEFLSLYRAAMAPE